MNLSKNTLYLAISMLMILAASNIFAMSIASDTLYLYEDGKIITDNSVIITYDNTKTICYRGECNIGQQLSPPRSRNLTFYKTNEPYSIDYDEVLSWRSDNKILEDKNCAGYITNKDEWKKAREQFIRETRDYYGELLNGAKTAEEKKEIWKEWEAESDTFMHQKGFNFFGNEECAKNYLRFPSSEEENNYLEQHINTALYHTAFVLPEPTDQESHGGDGRNGLYFGTWGTNRYFKVDIKTGDFVEGFGEIEYHKIRLNEPNDLKYTFIILILLLLIISLFLFLRKKLKKEMVRK